MTPGWLRFETKRGDKVTNTELYQASKSSINKLWRIDEDGKMTFDKTFSSRILRSRGQVPARLMSTALHLEEYDTFFARATRNKKKNKMKTMRKPTLSKMTRYASREQIAKGKYTLKLFEKYGYKINRRGLPGHGNLKEAYLFTFAYKHGSENPIAVVIYRNYEEHSISFIHWFLFGDTSFKKILRRTTMTNLMKHVQRMHSDDFATSDLFLEYWAIDGLPATEQPLVKYYRKYGFELFQDNDDNDDNAEKITQLALICYPDDPPEHGRDKLTFMKWNRLPRTGEAATKMQMEFIKLHF